MKKQISFISIMLMSLLLSPPLFARGGLSLDQAVRQAKERVDGRVISAETRENNGHRTHNIRILTDDGKLRRLRIDAGGERRKNNRR
ncbi:MAG: PepSY domain-containing protein [Candidatus Thiodiazotropha sp. (ex Myrtea sp. 'scaly one' KF741663)]|nr:PepSY domain-containing protein [Candidatus Thiodiazotropha sp. (ex Myrtea sp. 'scaly one' KF741663)]